MLLASALCCGDELHGLAARFGVEMHPYVGAEAAHPEFNRACLVCEKLQLSFPAT